jgi:NhaP-type Na+/H+ and K+/H+ antiporter
MLVPIAVACVGGLIGVYSCLKQIIDAPSDQERHFLMKAYSGLLVIAAAAIVLWLTIAPEYHWLIWMPGMALVFWLVIWAQRRIVHIRVTAALAHPLGLSSMPSRPGPEKQ